VLDSGARGSTTTFSQKHIGDVHLTWENEAYLEVKESEGELLVVYPPASIRAEPPVAVVDANVDRKGTRAAAEAYLKFLYTDEAQEVIAKHYYRPINLTSFVRDGDEAQQKFFAEGGIFDGIYQPGRK
jgi:sulfate transport system substrate-binding protein